MKIFIFKIPQLRKELVRFKIKYPRTNTEFQTYSFVKPEGNWFGGHDLFGSASHLKSSYSQSCSSEQWCHLSPNNGFVIWSTASLNPAAGAVASFTGTSWAALLQEYPFSAGIADETDCCGRCQALWPAKTSSITSKPRIMSHHIHIQGFACIHWRSCKQNTQQIRAFSLPNEIWGHTAMPSSEARSQTDKDAVVTKTF